jgi:hypothetical protein
MTIDEVLTYFGHKQANVARALGVCRNSICLWYKQKHIPYARQCQLELLTQGKLKANKND